MPDQEEQRITEIESFLTNDSPKTDSFDLEANTGQTKPVPKSDTSMIHQATNFDADKAAAALKLLSMQQKTNPLDQVQKLIDDALKRQRPSKTVSVKKSDVDHIMENTLVTKREADILMGMADGDLEKALELWLTLPTNHIYKPKDIR